MKRPSKGQRLAFRRAKLWNANPHCHWCGCLTQLPAEGLGRCAPRPPDNQATIDHLRFRLHPQRQEPNPQMEERTVLSCWKCNNDRNREEMKAVGIEKIQESSGSPPASKDKLIAVIERQAGQIRRLKDALIRHGLREEVSRAMLVNVIAKVEE